MLLYVEQAKDKKRSKATKHTLLQRATDLLLRTRAHTTHIQEMNGGAKGVHEEFVKNDKTLRER